MKELIVTLTSGHPSGRRRRAGFVIDSRPQIIYVTEEQEAVIRSDKFIKILKHNAEAKKRQEEEGHSIQQEEEKVMTKREIVACLLDMGLEEGKDFSKQSKKADLLALYNSQHEQA